MIKSQSDLLPYAQQNYNLVPLTREVLADYETPLSVYRKLAGSAYSFLFESVQGGEKWGRYSIIGLPCNQRFSVHKKRVKLQDGNQILRDEEVDDPLAEVEKFQAQFQVPEFEGLPRFCGGLVGFFGFDTVHSIEPQLAGNEKPDHIGAPDILLMVAQEVVVFDSLANRLILIVHVDPNDSDAFSQGQRRLDSICERLEQPMPPRPYSASSKPLEESDFKSSFTKQGFLDAVAKAKEYIIDGDIFQVVLSQQMTAPYDADPLDLYRALRTLNPSPYMYYLDLQDSYVVGSSPEILVRVEDGEVTVRPIAGTRRRGRDEAHDLAMEEELINDPKELSEHLMLVDLGRNDAGRVSKIGTVKVTRREDIERYSHVMHIVSNVTGELKDDLEAIDVLRATFPAGTVSGAPKIRAMEIIQELEPVKRGIYSGAIGYISWNGNMDTAIAIRTAIVSDKMLTIQAGAGVVADSVPELEWKETLNKARAVFKAAQMAQNRLQLGEHG
jgi:anthranilate synthase component 1